MLFLSSIRRWWRDRGRNIFSYHDGSAWRYADPVAVGSALEADLPDYLEILDILAKRPADVPAGSLRKDLVDKQRESLVKLAATARKVFKIAPLDDKTGWGATDAQAIGVVTRYFVFMEGLARKAELFTDSPGPVSESPPVSPTTSSAESGTAAS